MLLTIALVITFSVTAVAGVTGRDLYAKRSRLKFIFRVGCAIYIILVGLTVNALWSKSLDDLAPLLTIVMLIWGIPLASSGLSVLVFWGREQAAPDLPEIGFTPVNQPCYGRE